MITDKDYEAAMQMHDAVIEAMSKKPGFENYKQTLEEETMVKAQMLLFDEEEHKDD